MQIEEQIKALQRIKAKIDLYRNVAQSVASELASINQSDEHKALQNEHPGVIKEVCDSIASFCGAQVNSLSNPIPPAAISPPSPSPVDQEEAPQALQKAEPEKKVEDDEPTDVILFLKKYRHLDGKTVTVKTVNGDVQATVRGMIAPNIVVETVTGYTVKVKPRDLRVV